MQSFGLLYSRAEQFAVGMTLEGTINYSMPLLSKYVEIDKEYRKQASSLVNQPEFVRQIKRHLEVKDLCKNVYFFISPGFASPVSGNEQDNLINFQIGSKEMDFSKQLKAGLIQERSACGLINLSGFITLYLELNYIRFQARQAGFMHNLEEIVDGCALDGQQF